MKLIPIADDLRSKVEIKLMGCVTHLNRLRMPMDSEIHSLTPAEEKWLTPVEAAEHAGVSRPTIWRWKKEGLVTGRGGRVRRYDLDAWLARTTGQISKPAPATELLKLNQAAERAGVSRQTIWRWCNDGLKILSRGRVVRIRADVLDEYLRRGNGTN